MAKSIIESDVEQAALEILTELGYVHLYGPDIAPIEPGATLITGKFRNSRFS